MTVASPTSRMTHFSENRSDHLTSGRSLAHNAIWNLLGGGAPLLVALFCIPRLIRELGTSRFGVLTLAWVLVGYLSLFDLGLGRALTKSVSEKLGTEDEKEIPGLFWTSLVLMTALGFAGAAALAVISPELVHRFLRIPQSIQDDTLRSFYLLALSVPVVVSTAGLRGFLEALQRFELVNVIRVPLGVFTFAGPLLVLPFSRSLFPVVAVLTAGRLIACGANLLLCLHVMPRLQRAVVFRMALVGPLIRFGGWLTVSNIVSPLMVYLDRFVIGALVSVTAVAYYATPYEVTTKLLFVPSAVVGVLFPAFSARFLKDRSRTAVLLDQGMKYIFLGLFPIILIMVTLAHEGLSFWLGKDFARLGAPVLQWLSAGILLNALAQIPFAQVQGAGRPNLTAKLHLVELPCYLIALWWLIKGYGIVGAAIAFVARVGVDLAALLMLSRRLLPDSTAVIRRIAAVTAAGLLVLALGASIPSLPYKLAFLLLALLSLALGAWFLILTADERGIVQSRLRPSQISTYGD